eukprot:TRINITY_DN9076_c1_g1_i1.p1 TRINITY_DN9076_c1_g1~~TRINITY_DN9076_c1_g1_i1.p1  ORF type:complete len:370 (+),score=156.67 TRINITY_DN9076_c1_g1_i1:56-1165(+)
MDKQLAEIRKLHAERAARQRREEKDGSAAPAGPPVKKGKVIGGKYFATPPQQLGMKDYEAIVNRYQRILRQKKSEVVTKVEVDADTADLFQSFLRARGFAFLRAGILYGTVKDGVVHCHSCYEPEQECKAKELKLLEDKRLHKVDSIAQLLGLQRVGILVSAPYATPDDPVLTAQEVLLCAEQQAKYGDHCCLVQVRVGQDMQSINVEGYQVSSQCVDIYKEGTLSRGENPKFVHSERELEAVQEQARDHGGKAMVTKESTYDVDTVWFTVPIPIGGFQSEVVTNRFIRANRPGDMPPTWENVKIYLQDPKRRNKPFVEQVADFHLLVFLSDALDIKTDMPALIEGILKKDSDAIQGYETIIKSGCRML